MAFPLLATLERRNSELKRLQERVNYATRHDDLTGALNARTFAAAIENYVDRRKKTGSDSGGIMIAVVLDGLDDISRRYGAQWADSVVQSVTAIIQSSVRSGDLVARLATNELGIFLPGAAAENAQDIGRRVRRRLDETTFSASDAPLSIAVKLGGAYFETVSDFNEIRQMAGDMAFDDANDPSEKLSIFRMQPS